MSRRKRLGSCYKSVFFGHCHFFLGKHFLGVVRMEKEWKKYCVAGKFENRPRMAEAVVVVVGIDIRKG